MAEKYCQYCLHQPKAWDEEPCFRCRSKDKWTPAVKTNLKEDSKPDLGGQMKDGGERVTYDGGAKREPHQGKGRYDWISPFALGRVAKVSLELQSWNDRRDQNSQPEGMVVHAYELINSFREGLRDFDYLAAAAWVINAAMHYEAKGRLLKAGGYDGTGFDSISPHTLERLAKWCELGGIKYGARNWEKGMPYDHPLDSALRHINCWRKGLKEEDNLAAVLWNLFALMHYQACHMDKFDNIPRYPEAQGKGTVEQSEGNLDANRPRFKKTTFCGERPKLRREDIEDEGFFTKQLGEWTMDAPIGGGKTGHILKKVYVPGEDGKFDYKLVEQAIKRGLSSPDPGITKAIDDLIKTGYPGLKWTYSSDKPIRKVLGHHVVGGGVVFDVDFDPNFDIDAYIKACDELHAIKSCENLKIDVTFDAKEFEAAMGRVVDLCNSIKAKPSDTSTTTYSRTPLEPKEQKTSFANDKPVKWRGMYFKNQQELDQVPAYLAETRGVPTKTDHKRNYRIIVEDFDGTLCENKWPEIGKPNWEEICYLHERMAAGDKLILWTCREGDLLTQALNWCERWGITFDAVNDNIPETKAHFGNNPRKVSGDEYRDDKAVRVPFTK